MPGTVAEMAKLIEEISVLLEKPSPRDRSEARRKLGRLVAIASTLSLTLDTRR